MSPKVDEGEPATFTVALDEAGLEPVSVDYAVAGVTANVPADVAPASGTLTFAPGETAKQVTVQVAQDTAVEGDEAFRLALSNIVSERRVLRGESTTATIVDDEAETPPPADATAPVTIATGHPSGWSRQSVTVNLAATDEGSGVKEIAYKVGTTQKTVAGASASIPISAEGTTTIAYSAKDNAGNVEAEKTLVVRIDKTAPTVTCTATPGKLWPADNKLVPMHGQGQGLGQPLRPGRLQPRVGHEQRARGRRHPGLRHRHRRHGRPAPRRAREQGQRARLHAQVRGARRGRQRAHVHDYGDRAEDLRRGARNTSGQGGEGRRAARRAATASSGQGTNGRCATGDRVPAVPPPSAHLR